MDPSRRMKSCDSSPCFNRMMLQTPFLRPGAKFSAAQSKGRGLGTSADAYSPHLSRVRRESRCMIRNAGSSWSGANATRRSEAVCAKRDLPSTSNFWLLLDNPGQQSLRYPIDWSDVPGSKLHFLRDTAQMFAAVIGMRMRDHRMDDLSIRRWTQMEKRIGRPMR